MAQEIDRAHPFQPSQAWPQGSVSVQTSVEGTGTAVEDLSTEFMSAGLSITIDVAGSGQDGKVTLELHNEMGEYLKSWMWAGDTDSALSEAWKRFAEYITHWRNKHES